MPSECLKSFSGKAQDVLTGVVVLDAQTKQVISDAHKIKVYFRKLSNQEILAYIKTGNLLTKADPTGLKGQGLI